MKLSLGEDNSIFKPIDVANIDELQEVITKQNYSPAIYKDNHRTNDNFIQAELIALDFDSGLSIEVAKEVFKNYQHIIGTTRNHRKEKNGVVADRFRVILFLSEPISDSKTYRATLFDLLKKYPQADEACKDPARMFYPCASIYSQGSGVKVTPILPPPPVKFQRAELDSGVKGDLSRSTLGFLTFEVDSNWNKKLFKAAKDFQEQGYSVIQATNFLNGAVCGYKGRDENSDIKTIKSAYKDEPKHPPRIKNSAFDFKNMKQLLEEKPTIDWLVHGFLTVGGISVIAGQPKSGKSTIIRQLTTCVAQGREFLGRKVTQGRVLYLALEEQSSVIYEQFKKQGALETDPVTYHVGPLLRDGGWQEFKEYLMEERPALAVIDTLVLFADIKDQNNYSEVYQALTKYRTLARESSTHIVCIHHQNKSGNWGNNSVMGSSAFTGAVDAIMIFERVRSKRYLSSSQRGGLAFEKIEVCYDVETETYSLGAKFDEF